jgi:TRAP-type C4-dicarboxylate transport system substrate-binding protein
MVSITGAYYQNVVPEADAWKLLEKTPAEMRENGGWALMEKIHAEKGLKLLARIHYGFHFHLYLAQNKKIDGPNLKGLHLRVAPIYRNFFQAAGATTQRSNIAQVYTLMENGTVQGYGWPICGLRPGWEKVTGYRVDPGFYDADIQLMMNLRTWNRLSDEAKKLVSDLSLKYEKLAVEQDAKTVEACAKKQKQQGIETIEFTGEDRKKWLQQARDAAWAGVVKVSPKHGPKLRELMAK